MNEQRRTARTRTPRLIGLLVAGIAAASLMGALPAAAGAADYCVAPNTGCGANDVATFEQALDQADNAPDADRILLGAATYTARPRRVRVRRPELPVEIVGREQGRPL